MNQIGNIAFSQMTVGLFCDTHVQVNNLIKATGAEALHITAQASEYDSFVSQLMSIVRRSTTYISTEKINNLDKDRDCALGVIINIVKAHKTNTIASKRNAALELDAMMAPYKGIGTHEKRTETREVAGLLSVLSSQEAQAHLATLALTEEVEALTLKNAQFDVAFNQKMQEEVERMPQTSIDTEELRKQIDAKYSEIVQTVNAYAIVQPSEDINNFINQVNALLTLTKRSMASMGKDSNQEGPTEPETPDTPETPEGGTTPETSA